MQAGYSHAIGPAVASVQVTHGRGKVDLSVVQGGLTSEIHADQENVNSVNFMVEWGDWTARLGQVTSDVGFKIDIPAIPLTGLPGPQFKDKFTGLGFQYDNGKVVVITEYVQRKTTPKTFDSKAWYVAGGYRFGEVMPYVVISKYTPETAKSSKGTALGVRYDFAKNVALKAEFARYDTNGTLIFTDAETPAIADKKVNVISVALDFVF